MTCPGGFSCASLESFVNMAQYFIIPLAIAGSVILVRMFMSEEQEKSFSNFIRWLKK